MVLNNRVIAGRIKDPFYWTLVREIEQHNILDPHLLIIMIRTIKVRAGLVLEHTGCVLTAMVCLCRL